MNGPIRRFYLTTPLLFAISLMLLAACSQRIEAKPLAIGAKGPSFTLKNVDNNTVSLADFDSAPATVVVFTCNHCPYAQAYEDRIIRLQNEFASQGVKFVLINPNDPQIKPDDSFENMQKRAKEKNYPFPYLFDETQDIARAYGAFRTPEVYLLDDRHQLVYTGLVDDNTEEKEVKTHHLRDALNMVLAGRALEIDPNTTKAFGCTIKWRK